MASGPSVRSGLEIQAALTKFVQKWNDYSGTERSEAQTFLNELFACYGSDRKEVGAEFEHFAASAGFMDLFWPGHLIVEMKAPQVPLEKAKEQRNRYWQESSDSAKDVPAARFVVACNFGEFEIWEPGRFPNEARARFPLSELPDRYDALLFLQSDNVEPIFSEHRRELTTEAATHIAELYNSLADRSAAPIDVVQQFTMQVVWCLFAEDLGILDGYPLQNTVDDLLKQREPDSARDIGYLFSLLNQKGDHNRQGRYLGTHYVNGDLFRRPAAVLLNRTELEHLRAAAEFNWRAVDPTIFGSLMEGVLGEERRDKLGAHYTHESDIMKIVIPTIVRPWRERIAATSKAVEARALLDELCAFRVLDPACGCGNFLYVAYRELRGLEFELKQRIASFSKSEGTPSPAGSLPYFPLTNVHGIDIEGIAVLIARVTLWMGHRQMIDRYGEAEPVLPLVDLSGIRRADALHAEWPEVDAIIGNPPFLGSQLLRASLGGSYVEWLGSHFGVGIRDLCVYWFRKTQDVLKPGQRAGLVGTNSIMQNRGREASLDYIIANGGIITNAVSTQKWPGEAKVHVSIVNWIKQPKDVPTEFDLDGKDVSGITSSLTADSGDSWRPLALAANRDHCFQGPIPVGAGFIISSVEAEALLSDVSADYSLVVRPYLTASDIADRIDQSPSRWIIDFAQLALEQATRFPRALEVVRREVKPFRETVRREGHRKHWWIFGEPRVGMRKALAELERFIVVGAHGKRMLIAWQDPRTLASNANMVFAFDDDYSMGILLSRAHDAWAWAQSSTLETRLRYTPSTVFETFPWPDPITQAHREEIAAASADLYARRSALCIEHEIGLTRLYNLMDDGAFTDLAALHRRLDESVAAAYGWPKSVAQDAPELVRRLTELNRQISQGDHAYNPFRAL
ncbi:MAG: class I SAM-dependent DNA methyltransferase [Microbacteriaceae bacterium]|nr:class I SAM-dependent DNA methyltransferase [Cryobacterium sp.]MCC7127429.1 class I SAM-dependent DNA methyltransferase [Microbacteriaceae bacterium]